VKVKELHLGETEVNLAERLDALSSDSTWIIIHDLHFASQSALHDITDHMQPAAVNNGKSNISLISILLFW